MSGDSVTVRIGSLITQLSVGPIHHHGTVRLGEYHMQPEAALKLGQLLIQAANESRLSKE